MMSIALMTARLVDAGRCQCGPSAISLGRAGFDIAEQCGADLVRGLAERLRVGLHERELRDDVGEALRSLRFENWELELCNAEGLHRGPVDEPTVPQGREKCRGNAWIKPRLVDPEPLDWDPEHVTPL